MVSEHTTGLNELSRHTSKHCWLHLSPKKKNKKKLLIPEDPILAPSCTHMHICRTRRYSAYCAQTSRLLSAILLTCIKQ